MGKRKTRIRARILVVFSVMLLLSFSLIGIIFNISVGQYIQSSAISQLDQTYNEYFVILNMEQAETLVGMQTGGTAVFLPHEAFPDRPSVYSSKRNTFRISANMIIVDDNYTVFDEEDISNDAREIIQAIRDINIPITGLKNIMLRTSSGVYYVSAFQTPDNPMVKDNSIDGSYSVIYADVTGLMSFAVTVNTILVVLVCVMFIITVFVTFFLSKTITRPIERLGVAAAKIGRGDFTPNNFKFMDVEFESLNVALNNSAKQLGIYDSEQKTFFQNVSHELRTPLMSIQCQAEGISFNLMDPVKASETILSETQRLSELVTDLLYISKIDNISAVYEATKVDLIEILRSCANRQKTVADKKGVSFLFDYSEPSVECECVGELIGRVIDNLISNAIRYAASEVTLSCHATGRQVVLRVTDDGSGIDPDSLPHIFERFYKGSGGNYGIGLSIVKSIVEQHHGSITAKNTDVGGAAFTVVLPLLTRR